jgi:hypothetical protein
MVRLEYTVYEISQIIDISLTDKINLNKSFLQVKFQ